MSLTTLPVFGGVVGWGAAEICMDNLTPKSLQPGHLGEIIIHEWAHSCGWDHGDGQGVPRDRARLRGDAKVISRQLVLALLISLSWLGCQTVIVDVRTEFLVEGRVTTESGDGVPAVQVRFFDTGLDQWTRNKSEGIVVGYTDGQGRLTAPFAYHWGYAKKEHSPPDVPGTFSLIFSKEGLSPIVQDFKVTSLEKVDENRIVRFRVTVPSPGR
jgi:hypothetical protein